jgi:hypothetical protein
VEYEGSVWICILAHDSTDENKPKFGEKVEWDLFARGYQKFPCNETTSSPYTKVVDVNECDTLYWVASFTTGDYYIHLDFTDVPNGTTFKCFVRDSSVSTKEGESNFYIKTLKSGQYNTTNQYISFLGVNAMGFYFFDIQYPITYFEVTKFNDNTYFGVINTGNPLYLPPTVTTTSATSITSTGATTGGNVTSDGGNPVIARGVVYGTTQNPTTANSTTSNGIGTGVFTSTLTGLTANTTYYVRAYATNIGGTSYGNEISFTTTNNAGGGVGD